MTKSNMDTFNEYAAKIFDHLYAEFPKPTEIRQNNIVDDPTDKSKRDVFFGDDEVFRE